ncbi:MAG: MFS transporter [Cyanobacteria bacterium P01_F01_bin.143]
MRIFFLVWFGQFITLIGAGLTKFTLQIWVYEQTSSATKLALISVFTTLPWLMMLPVAGVIIDRINPRWAIIIGEAATTISLLIIFLPLTFNHLALWVIYLAIIIQSIFSAFNYPGYAIAKTILVPKQYVGKANGLVLFSYAMKSSLSPAIAGILILLIKFQGIILINIALCLFSLLILFLIRFPTLEEVAKKEQHKTFRWRDIIFGWQYIKNSPALVALLVFFAFSYYTVAVFTVLSTPLLLSITTVSTLGTVLAIAGSGMILGSIANSLWGGTKNRVRAILACQTICGLSMIVIGSQTFLPNIAIAGFIFAFSVSTIYTSSQVIWQVKIPIAYQGRVFAIRDLITWILVPIGALTAAPLVDYVFEPLMWEGEFLANSLGQLIGVGEGRGIGLFYILLGILNLIITAIAYGYSPLRFLEKRIPDAI